MQLSSNSLTKIKSGNISIPDKALLDLPEKILQFGTGALLRALPDYFIDKANKLGIFNGRIVVVKTTDGGDYETFAKQNNLYTVCVRGIQQGKPVEENIINSSISRVLHASHEWQEILICAHNPALQIIISNTTEVGIRLVNENIRLQPPISFPGKLLAFLHERFIALGGSIGSGFVIVPTELIPDNAQEMKAIVIELAHLNRLNGEFIKWLQEGNYFCNSLVDRIVTGVPVDEKKCIIEKELGYDDNLLTICEVYKLWAIEGNEHIQNVLTFSKADNDMIIAPDITLYRELKLRLLNGTHTLSCGIAFLAGIDTVKEAIHDEIMGTYISSLMRFEIAPFIPQTIEESVLQDYIGKVLDRFNNPQIDHYWKSITLNYTQKIRLRCVPVLLNYYKKNNDAPELFAIGFAAWFAFMHPAKQDGNQFFGEFKGDYYLIQDEAGEILNNAWQKFAVEEIVSEVFSELSLWGSDLTTLPGFADAVTVKLRSIINHGMKNTLEMVFSGKKN